MDNRIQHVYLDRNGKISQALHEYLQLSEARASELIWLGAVWHCLVPPAIGKDVERHCSQQHLERLADVRRRAIQARGTKAVLQQPRRVTEDQDVPAFSYMRVHTQVKRFPLVHQVEWPSRVLHMAPHYVVANKPAGVQVAPTVDNVRECLPACVQQALGLQEPLINTHRLDEGTEGVVVLARTHAFASHFQRMIKDRPDALTKVYRCLTLKAPALGLLQHHMVVGVRHRGSPKFTAAVAGGLQVPGSCLCQLRVLSVQQVQLAGPWQDLLVAAVQQQQGQQGQGQQGQVLQQEQAQGQHEQQAQDEGAEAVVRHPTTGNQADDPPQHAATSSSTCSPQPGLPAPAAYEVQVELITGRTHQVRAQLAAQGCSLLGDGLYQALEAMGTMWLGCEEGKEEEEEGPGRAQGVAACGGDEAAAEAAATTRALEEQQVGAGAAAQEDVVPAYAGDSSGKAGGVRGGGASGAASAALAASAGGVVDWRALLGPLGQQRLALQAHVLRVCDDSEEAGAMWGVGDSAEEGGGAACCMEFCAGPPPWRIDNAG